MSTLSTNQIVVEYIVKGDEVLKAKDKFDGLTKAEMDSLDALKKINDQLKSNGDQAKKSGDDLVNALGKSDNQVKGFGSSLKGITPLLAGAFSVAAISAFAKQVVETKIKFEGYSQAIKFGSGSAENFAKNQEFLNNLINKYGLGLASATEAYKQFFTASTLAGQSQNETNRQFEAVTKAGTVLALTTDQMQGAFMALGQMMSKGTVQAEELRGQLGERIPGAFSIMAKALNVSEVQLNKMLEQGQVLSKDALPAFASELEKTFGPAAEKNLNGMVNAQNKFNNAIDGLVLAVGEKLEPFLKGAYNLAAGIANELAKVGKAAKKESAENLGLKRAEADIVKQLIKYGGSYTVQNAKFLRQQEATLLLLGMEEKIDAQSLLVIEKKLQAVGNLGGRAKLNLENAEKELAILRAEEKELEKIAGIKTVPPPPPPPPLTDKEKKAIEDAKKKQQKAIEDEYKRKVEILNLEKQITAEKIKQTVGADGQKIAMMELEFATNLKLLKLSEEYSKVKTKQGTFEVKEAKDKAKILPEIIKTQNQEITQETINAGIKDRETRVKGEDEVQQGIYDAKLKAIERNKMIQEAAIESENLTDFQRSEKLIQNEILANEQIMAANDEAANNGVESALDANAKILADNAKLYRELAELRKKDAEDQKKLNIERVQAVSQVASAVLDGFMNLQQQQTQKELAALNSKYESEIRLAGDNEQKVMELNEKRRQEEKQLRIKEFEAQRAAAIAQVVFKTAPIIAEYFTTGFLAPLAIAGLAIAAAQIGFIAAQPVPEFKEGTKGKPFKGGKAIVGEIGKEWVVTTSGQVYETPGVATLVDLPKGSQVIPHNEVIRAEKYMGSKLMREGRGDGATGHIVNELISIKDTLSKLPITSLTMDERGFTKKIQTKSRETRILNNRFGN